MFRKLSFASAILLAGLGAANASVITTTTVVDESSQLVGRPASNLVSGVGFMANPGSFSSDPSTMWLTANSSGDSTAFVTFQFDHPYALSGIKIWQYNEDSGTPVIELARGTQSGLVQISSDGVNFSTVASLDLLEAAGNTTSDVTNSILLSGTATYVRLENLVSFAGPNNYVGLSQVQFSAADVPEPMSISLMIAAIAGVWFTRRSLTS